jgi:hypothetical protein
MLDEDARRVRPNGLAVRGLRHQRGWSPRALIEAIEAASRAATGIPESITPNLLEGIEERDEIIPYGTLCLVAAGLDCDPVDILGRDALPGVESAG